VPYNKGEAYDQSTGVYTAPYDGVYHFDLLATNKHPGYVYYGIYDYETKQPLAQTAGEKAYQPYSLSINVVLYKGQKVAAGYKGGLYDGSYYPGGDEAAQKSVYSFSGYLVSYKE
jgi:hypothetical protein